MKPIERSGLYRHRSPVTLPDSPLGDPSDRMRLANAIAASLEADPALVDDLRNALTDRVATRLHRDWKRSDDERSHITTGSIRTDVPWYNGVNP